FVKGEFWVIFDSPILQAPDWLVDYSIAEDVLDYVNRAIFLALPTGAFRETQISYDQMLRDTLLNRSLPPAQRIEEESRRFNNPHGEGQWLPWTLLLQPEKGAFLERHLDSEILLHSARAAVAAERYRLARGRYPESWAELVPEWLPSIPKDVWSGGDLIYHLGPDGRPVIYSVGQNGIDEGGLPKQDRSQGDLVWRYSLPEGYTLDDSKK
ncbi:MAG: hypothetical protein KDM64_17985, partial [Verrucomicrobiae bacterium]|nr:hypothetical protein [Verrucomicrobiae bacterium]